MTGPVAEAGAAGLRVLVQEARLRPGGEPLRAEALGEAAGPTLPGVELTRARTFADARRVLVVTYNSQEPPGTLGYSVVVRPGQAVGDHYHHRREERIVVLYGRAEFRLLDCRPGSPALDRLNRFTLEEPGSCVRIPAGVAHTIVAEGGPAVLQVLASCDYDPEDDVPVPLSRLE
ncbi:MAG TPA: cupin domain-containing protein [Gemmatimonadales bacterium]|nr:cupin domain-containing protein [Gemmatimonadales bacterium]